jgi:hypothetical protein
MLSELKNPSLVYPFYDIPKNIDKNTLLFVNNVKKLQLAIGLYKKI